MKENKALYREIINEKKLSENIPIFLKKHAGVNCMMSGMELSISYYNLREAFYENRVKYSDEYIEFLKEFNQILCGYFIKDFNKKNDKDAILELDTLRNKIIDKMQMITIYSDKFLLYEYIIKRMSINYDDIITDMNQEDEHNKVMNYINSGKDNATINTRIRNMLYHMPVRITKTKFFDLIKNAVYRFIGQECSDLLNFIYVIKTSAGIKEQSDKDELYEKKLRFFANVDFDYADREEYKFIKEEMTQVTSLLFDETDNYYSLQEIVNSFYTLLLNIDLAECDERQYIDKLLETVDKVNKNFDYKTDADKELDIANVDDVFKSMEGRLEEYSEKLNDCQMVFSKIKEGNDSLYGEYKNLELYKNLNTSELLLSGSRFIDFRIEKSNEIVDKKYVDEVIQMLKDEFINRFKEQSRSLNRAMTASVLKELPVFFFDMKEVSDYVKASLSGCHDIAERKISCHMLLDESENE